MTSDNLHTPGTVLKITDDRHWLEVRNQCAEQGKILVADFGASWCGPCKRIYPQYEALCKVSASDAETSNLFVFTKIDVDQCARAAAQEGATSVPLFKTYYDDRVIHSARGGNPEQLRAMLEAAHNHWQDIQETLVATTTQSKEGQEE